MLHAYTAVIITLLNFNHDFNRMQFGQTLGGRFGPDSFSTLQRCLKEEAKTLSLKAALAIVSYYVQLTLHPDALFVTALTMFAL
jgi:hypothetical protein